MRVAKPRDWVPIGSPCTYAASAGISAAGRSQQPSPLLATPSPGATSRGTTATRPPTRSRTRPPSSHSPPRPMPTPSRTPRPGSQRCPTTRSPTRAEGSSGHGNGAGASRSRTNPGPAQAGRSLANVATPERQELRWDDVVQRRSTPSGEALERLLNDGLGQARSGGVRGDRSMVMFRR